MSAVEITTHEKFAQWNRQSENIGKNMSKKKGKITSRPCILLLATHCQVSERFSVRSFLYQNSTGEKLNKMAREQTEASLSGIKLPFARYATVHVRQIEEWEAEKSSNASRWKIGHFSWWRYYHSHEWKAEKLPLFYCRLSTLFPLKDEAQRNANRKKYNII